MQMGANACKPSRRAANSASREANANSIIFRFVSIGTNHEMKSTHRGRRCALICALADGYSMADIRYYWQGKSAVKVDPDVMLPQFKILGHKQKEKEIVLSTGKMQWRCTCTCMCIWRVSLCRLGNGELCRMKFARARMATEDGRGWQVYLETGRGADVSVRAKRARTACLKPVPRPVPRLAWKQASRWQRKKKCAKSGEQHFERERKRFSKWICEADFVR